VELAGGSGRRSTVEVHGEAAGAGQAPAQAEERHVLVVIQPDGVHRAVDLSVSAPEAGRLAGLEEISQHALLSVVFQR